MTMKVHVLSASEDDLLPTSALMTLSLMQKRKTKNHHKVQNGDRSRQDKTNDKQPKWLQKSDQDKRSEARRSVELQVSWGNHL